MRKVVHIPIKDVIPDAAAILRSQGIPESALTDSRLQDLVKRSLAIYQNLADPLGILEEIPIQDFSRIYNGQGYNDEETPLRKILSSAADSALYLVTIGKAIPEEITRLFNENEFALGAMLDCTASEGTEMAAQEIESYYQKWLTKTGRIDSSSRTMRFSPGYCGWHLTGQKALFAIIRPEEIGVELLDSFLMYPLKSISGVILTGPAKIFDFNDDFPFCSNCDTHSCRERIKIVSEQKPI